MKIAYISVYRDQTGYGNFAQNMILALDAAGAEVCPVWITLSGAPKSCNSRIEELEKNSPDNVDVVIQQILPSHFCRIEGVKNIGLFFWETTHFRGSGWQSSCNLMDEIWVVTEEQKKACEKSGVTVPVRIIDSPKDFGIYEKQYEKLSVDSFIDDTFKFYTISDFSYRKNVFGLINTFMSTFTSQDNVSLIIKGFVTGQTYDESFNYLKSAVEEIKAGLRRPEWSYPRVVFISDRFSETQMCSLHSTCDCFVSASRGEGDGIPMVDAAGFNNITISPGWNGPRKNFEDTGHILISNLLEKGVTGMSHQIKGLYNWDESWFEPSSYDIGVKMREVYENQTKFKKLATSSYPKLKKRFDLVTVGEKLMEAMA
jgi:glycosyltransferase involved in cell wall biosynthesis